MTSAFLDHRELRQRVDTTLAEFLHGKRARLLALDASLAPVADAVCDFVLGGGKRIRPSFAYWGYRGTGGHASDAVISAVSCLELVQANALIHDDVMDGSDTRRGEPSIHRRFEELHRASGWHGPGAGFGMASAILLGDLCLGWSAEMLHTAGLSASALARALPVFDRMCAEVTLGQYLDVQTQAEGTTSRERASLIAQIKSAKYTVERPLLLGAAIAGAPAAITTAYSAYGLLIGEAFQLRDDILGVFGDPDKTGKPAGDDLREGKRTYLIAAALDVASETDKITLTTSLGDRAMDSPCLDHLRSIIVETGALARVEQRIEELHTSAIAAIADVSLLDEARHALTALAEKAAHRDG